MAVPEPITATGVLVKVVGYLPGLLRDWVANRLALRGLRLTVGTHEISSAAQFSEVVNARFDVDDGYPRQVHAQAKFAIRSVQTGSVIGPFRVRRSSSWTPFTAEQVLAEPVISLQPGFGSDMPIAARVGSRFVATFWTTSSLAASAVLSPGDYIVRLHVSGNFPRRVQNYRLTIPSEASERLKMELWSKSPTWWRRLFWSGKRLRH